MTPPSLRIPALLSVHFRLRVKFKISSPPPVYVEVHECFTYAFHNPIKDDTGEGACFDPMYTLTLIETWLQDGYDVLLRTFRLETPSDQEVTMLIVRS